MGGVEIPLGRVGAFGGRGGLNKYVPNLHF